MRKKRSPIWLISHSELAKIVKESLTFGGILSHFGLNNKGGNMRTLQSRLDTEGISCSHIPRGRGANKNVARGGAEVPLSQIMVENSQYKGSTSLLKRRVVAAGLLKYECSICGLKDKWNNNTLVLQIDHINGKRNDNRLDNLRILCPNCHSQTNTFAGKNG